MRSRFHISIKWKIFALVAFLISCAILVVLNRTSYIFREDKGKFVKELSAKLSGSLAKNLSNRISALQDKLVIFISLRESLSNTGIKLESQLPVLFSQYQEFIAIALVNQGASGFEVSFVLRNPQGPAMKWPLDYEKGILSRINFSEKALAGRNFWTSYSPDKSPLSVLGFSVHLSPVNRKEGASTASWILGILSPSAFDDLLNEYSTGLNTAMIVTHEGLSVGHSDLSKRWKNLSTHPMVAEIMKNSKPAETASFKDLDGRAIVGSYETLSSMNLTAAVTTPEDKAYEAANELLKNILFIGVIILILALSAAVFLSNLMTSPLQKLAAVAAQIGSGNFKVAVEVETNDEIGELAQSFSKMEKGLLERDEALHSAQAALVQSEKMGAFGQLSAGIAHEVKNPLAGILGHAQLAQKKTQSDEVKKHLEVIEKETRRCKTIVESLMKFARAEKAQLQPTDLAAVVQDTINLVDHQLALSGCKIIKDIKPCPMVEGNANQLQQVLLNLMVNASHAMEARSTRNVTVRLLRLGDKAQIQVEDTGSGMSPEVQKKIFEPFFTTKPTGKGTGLGLSVTMGIVKDHKGEIHLKSEINKGTTFYIDLPIPPGAQMPVAVEPSRMTPPLPVMENEPFAAKAKPNLKMIDPASDQGKISKPLVKPGAPSNVKPMVKEEFFSEIKVKEPSKTPSSQVELTVMKSDPAKAEKSSPEPKELESTEEEFKVIITRPKMKG